MTVKYSKLSDEIRVSAKETTFPDYETYPEYIINLLKLVNYYVSVYYKPIKAPKTRNIGNYSNIVTDLSRFGYNIFLDEGEINSCIADTMKRNFMTVVTDMCAQNENLSRERTLALGLNQNNEAHIRNVSLNSFMLRHERTLYRNLQIALAGVRVEVNDFIAFLQLLNNDYYRFLDLVSFYPKNIRYILMHMPTNMNGLTAAAALYKHAAKIMVNEASELIRSAIAFKSSSAETVRSTIMMLLGSSFTTVDAFTDLPTHISQTTGVGMIQSILMCMLSGSYVRPYIPIPKDFNLHYLVSFPIFLTVFPRTYIPQDNLRHAVNMWLYMLFKGANNNVRQRVFGQNAINVTKENAVGDANFVGMILPGEGPLADFLDLGFNYPDPQVPIPGGAIRFINDNRGFLYLRYMYAQPERDDVPAGFRIYLNFCAWLHTNFNVVNMTYTQPGRKKVEKLMTIMEAYYEMYRRMCININMFCDANAYYSLLAPGNPAADANQENKMVLNVTPSDALSMAFGIEWQDVVITLPSPNYILNGIMKNYEFDQFIINLYLAKFVLTDEAQLRLRSKKIVTSVASMTPDTTGIIAAFMNKYEVDLISTIFNPDELIDSTHQSLRDAFLLTYNTLIERDTLNEMGISLAFRKFNYNLLHRDPQGRWTTVCPDDAVPANNSYLTHLDIDRAKNDTTLLAQYRRLKRNQIDALQFHLPVKMYFKNYDEIAPLKSVDAYNGWDFTGQLFKHNGIYRVWSFRTQSKVHDSNEYLNEEVLLSGTTVNDVPVTNYAAIAEYMGVVTVFDERCELFNVNQHVKVVPINSGFAFPYMQ